MILAIVAVVRIRRSHGRLRGQGLAIAAMVLAVALSNPFTISFTIWLVDSLCTKVVESLWVTV